MRWLVFLGLAACNSTLEPALPDNVAPDARAFAVAHSHTLVIDQLGAMQSLGSDLPEPVDSDGNAQPPTLPLAAGVAVGLRHGCIVSTTGSVHCWGDNGGGALGAHRVCPAPTTDVPAACVLGADVMPTLPPVRAVAAGDDVSCAITRDDDEVLCWGAQGRLGGSRVPALDRPEPVQLPDGSGPLRVSRLIASLGTVCALGKDDGTLWCWGDGFGALPVLQPQTGVVDIALGARHSCLIDSTGLSCWGQDLNAEVTGDVERARGCGNGPCEVTEPVHLDIAAQRVVVGERHTCALAGSDVLCWGSNEVGQLGRDDAFLVGGIEAAVLGGEDIAAGYAHACALKSDGVWCWGSTAFADTEE